MSKMGTPADGFCKPHAPEPGREPMTIREAVTKYGDEWRLMISGTHFIRREHMETQTGADWEAGDMLRMERGQKSRIKVEDING